MIRKKSILQNIWVLSALAIGLVYILTYLVLSYFDFQWNAKNNKSFFFAHPEYFQFFWGIIPIYFAFVYNQLNNRKIVAQFASHSHEKGFSSFYYILKFILINISITGIILALAQPVFGKKKVGGYTKSMEMVVCLDVSNSMNTRDIDNTSRLDISKRALNALIDQLSGEKIGLCLFAGDAIVQLPLTSDYNTARLFIDDVQSSYLSQQGTNAVAALECAGNMFSKEEPSKVIFLLTDGENHEAPESEIFEFIRSNHIQLCALGIGTESGGPIPEDPNYPESGFKRDEYGSTVISKMNPGFIRSLADKANGSALITSEAYPDIVSILTEINRMKRTKSRNLNFEVSSSVYEYPVFVSFISMLIWIILFRRRAYA